MKDPNEHMDDSVRNKFQEHEVPVPDHLWKSVSSRLPAEPEATRTSFWSSSISKRFLITAGVLSLIGGTLYLSQPDSVNLSGTSTPLSTGAVVQTTDADTYTYTYTTSTDPSTHNTSTHTYTAHPDKQEQAASGNSQAVTINTVQRDASNLSGTKNTIRKNKNTSRYLHTATSNTSGVRRG